VHGGQRQKDEGVGVPGEVVLAEERVFVESILDLGEGGVIVKKSLHCKEQIYNKKTNNFKLIYHFPAPFPPPRIISPVPTFFRPCSLRHQFNWVLGGRW